MKKFMPIAIDVSGKTILLVGGGKQALHKVELLQRFTNNIKIIGTQVDQRIKDSGLSYIEADYKKEHLDDIYVVYACTNNREINKKVREDAHKKSILCNVADDPEICDFVSPAMFLEDDMIVSVTSNGRDVHRSILWRNKIKEFLLGKTRDFK